MIDVRLRERGESKLCTNTVIIPFHYYSLNARDHCDSHGRIRAWLKESLIEIEKKQGLARITGPSPVRSTIGAGCAALVPEGLSLLLGARAKGLSTSGGSVPVLPSLLIGLLTGYQPYSA